MKTIQKIEPQLREKPLRKRTAAYCRVSKITDRTTHSMSSQVSYYSKLIQCHLDWEYAGVYADFGISATQMENRPEFLRLLEDCEQGKIDLVLTKSISRFARNTTDLLKTIRHLKSLGVDVYFEKENIHSVSGDGEVMLSILASLAQEEIQSLSDNIKWKIRKSFQAGTGSIPNGRLLGYAYDGENYQIVPEEAKMIKEIFSLYLDGVTLRDICKTLNDKGYRTWRGTQFSYYPINYIVRNEMYCGDRVFQKCYVTDPFTKNKVKNNGELPKYIIENDHEPIIDRTTFENAQQEFQRRNKLATQKYPLSRKMKCAICGNIYARQTAENRKYAYWICNSRKKGGKCGNRNFREEDLIQVAAIVLGLKDFDERVFTEKVKQILVLADGDLMFEFYDGRKMLWENK